MEPLFPFGLRSLDASGRPPGTGRSSASLPGSEAHPAGFRAELARASRPPALRHSGVETVRRAAVARSEQRLSTSEAPQAQPRGADDPVRIEDGLERSLSKAAGPETEPTVQGERDSGLDPGATRAADDPSGTREVGPSAGRETGLPGDHATDGSAATVPGPAPSDAPPIATGASTDVPAAPVALEDPLGSSDGGAAPAELPRELDPAQPPGQPPIEMAETDGPPQTPVVPAMRVEEQKHVDRGELPLDSPIPSLVGALPSPAAGSWPGGAGSEAAPGPAVPKAAPAPPSQPAAAPLGSDLGPLASGPAAVEPTTGAPTPGDLPPAAPELVVDDSLPATEPVARADGPRTPSNIGSLAGVPGSPAAMMDSPAAAPAGTTVVPDSAQLERADQVLRQLRVRIAPDLREANVELEPAALGRITIRVRFADGHVRAALHAHQPGTLAVLQHHAPELRAMFEQAGFDAPELEMGLAFAGGDGRTGSDGTQASSQDIGTPWAATAACEAESSYTQQNLTLALAHELGVDTYA